MHFYAAGECAAWLAVPPCLLTPGSLLLLLLLLLLQERYPQYQFGVGEEGEGSKEMIDNSRVQRELGLSITPAKETLLDMAATLIQLGLATPKQRSSSGA